jgi:hypothetical protein
MIDGISPQHEPMFIQVGGDGLNMNIFGCYSAQVFGARCEDLHPDDAYKKSGWRILLVMEGPQECTNLNQALKATVDEAMRSSPMLPGELLMPILQELECEREIFAASLTNINVCR